MPDWVSGPTIGPEALAVGIPNLSPNGAKEIYFDSSAVRASYERGGLDPSSYAAEFTPVPENPDPAQAPATPAEALPPEVIEAMRAGKPPPPHLMVPLAAASAAPRPLPSPFASPPSQSSGAIEMTIPVGGGVTARVVFVGGVPSSRQWHKLIRHLEIEAEEEPDDGRLDKAVMHAFAPGADRQEGRGDNLRAEQHEGRSAIPRSVKRRKRKDVGSAAEPGQP